MSKLSQSAVGPIPVWPHKTEIKRLTKSFGHEGPSYNCEVWFDGQRACNAIEEGSGGGVMLHWFDREWEKKLDAYAATYPKVDLYDKEDREKASKMPGYNPEYMLMTMHLDDLIDEWVGDWIEDTDMRKKCAKAICYHTPDQPEGEYWVNKIPFTEGNVAKILAKYPGAEIFNLKFGKPIPDAEAPAPPTESLGLTKEMAQQLNGCLNEIRMLHRAQDEPKSPLAKKGWKPMPFEEKLAKENDIWARLEKLQTDLGSGFRVGKLINFSVADGRAHYLMLKIGKSLTELAHLPFGDAYQADAVETVDKVVGGKRKLVHQCLTSIAKRQCVASDGLKAMFAGAKA